MLKKVISLVVAGLFLFNSVAFGLAPGSRFAPMTNNSVELQDIMKLTAEVMSFVHDRPKAGVDLTQQERSTLHDLTLEHTQTIDKIASPSPVKRNGNILGLNFRSKRVLDGGKVIFVPAYVKDGDQTREYLWRALKIGDGVYSHQFFTRADLAQRGCYSIRSALDDEKLLRFLSTGKRSKDVEKGVENFVQQQNDTDRYISDVIAGRIAGKKAFSLPTHDTRIVYVLDFLQRYIQNSTLANYDFYKLIESGQVMIIPGLKKSHAGDIGIYLSDSNDYTTTLVHEVFAKCGFSHEECLQMEGLYRLYIYKTKRDAAQEALFEKAKTARFLDRSNDLTKIDYYASTTDDKEGARIREAIANHVRAFGKAPEAAAIGPGRINLIGEHIDYAGGLVLPVALKGVNVITTVSRNHSGKIVIYSPRFNYQYEQSAKLFMAMSADQDAGKNASAASWVRYPLGVIRQLMAAGVKIEGLNICYDGNVSLAGGLSSSAAVETSVFTALKSLLRFEMDSKDAARLCRRAEHWTGNHCGIMDMFASIHGKEGKAILLNCNTLEHEEIDLSFLDKAGYSIVAVDTKLPKTDQSWKTYNKRIEELGLAVDSFKRLHQINPAYYPDVKTIEDLAVMITPDILYTAQGTLFSEHGMDVLIRMQHVVSEQARVMKFIEIAKKAEEIAKLDQMVERNRQSLAGQVYLLGKLLFESHNSLKGQYQVSSPQLDLLVEEAAAHGAVGARLTGAGFVGCTVNIVPKERIEEFRREVSAAYKEKFNIEPEITVSQAGNGAEAIALDNKASPVPAAKVKDETVTSGRSRVSDVVKMTALEKPGAGQPAAKSAAMAEKLVEDLLSRYSQSEEIQFDLKNDRMGVWYKDLPMKKHSILSYRNYYSILFGSFNGTIMIDTDVLKAHKADVKIIFANLEKIREIIERAKLEDGAAKYRVGKCALIAERRDDGTINRLAIVPADRFIDGILRPIPGLTGSAAQPAADKLKVSVTFDNKPGSQDTKGISVAGVLISIGGKEARFDTLTMDLLVSRILGKLLSDDLKLSVKVSYDLGGNVIFEVGGKEIGRIKTPISKERIEELKSLLEKVVAATVEKNTQDQAAVGAWLEDRLDSTAGQPAAEDGKTGVVKAQITLGDTPFTVTLTRMLPSELFQTTQEAEGRFVGVVDLQNTSRASLGQLSYYRLFENGRIVSHGYTEAWELKAGKELEQNKLPSAISRLYYYIINEPAVQWLKVKIEGSPSEMIVLPNGDAYYLMAKPRAETASKDIDDRNVREEELYLQLMGQIGEYMLSAREASHAAYPPQIDSVSAVAQGGVGEIGTASQTAVTATPPQPVAEADTHIVAWPPKEKGNPPMVTSLAPDESEPAYKNVHFVETYELRTLEEETAFAVANARIPNGRSAAIQLPDKITIDAAAGEITAYTSTHDVVALIPQEFDTPEACKKLMKEFNVEKFVPYNRNELENLPSELSKYKNKKVVLVSIGLDDAAGVKALVDGNKEVFKNVIAVNADRKALDDDTDKLYRKGVLSIGLLGAVLSDMPAEEYTNSHAYRVLLPLLQLMLPESMTAGDYIAALMNKDMDAADRFFILIRGMLKPIEPANVEQLRYIVTTLIAA